MEEKVEAEERAWLVPDTGPLGRGNRGKGCQRSHEIVVAASGEESEDCEKAGED